MEIDLNQMIIPVAGVITALGGAWLTLQKINSNIRKSRKQESASILQEAKEEDALIRIKLEARIETLKAELANLKLNIDKDMDHLKETYNNEIKNLGEKIESLRGELSNQHSSIVALLSKLVEKNK